MALAVSSYTKRRFVDHTNYNQTDMVKTIELILGSPPMNQLDLSATPMRRCFQIEPDGGVLESDWQADAARCQPHIQEIKAAACQAAK